MRLEMGEWTLIHLSWYTASLKYMAASSVFLQIFLLCVILWQSQMQSEHHWWKKVLARSRKFTRNALSSRRNGNSLISVEVKGKIPCLKSNSVPNEYNITWYYKTHEPRYDLFTGKARKDKQGMMSPHLVNSNVFWLMFIK